MLGVAAVVAAAAAGGGGVIVVGVVVGVVVVSVFSGSVDVEVSRTKEYWRRLDKYMQ